MADPFTGRSEITSEEYRSWIDRIAQDPRNALTMSPEPSQPERGGRSHSAALRGMKESAFRDAVVALARYRCWLVYWTWNSKHSPAGFPDLVMVRGERAVDAELKIRPNKPTKDQLDWLAALAATGDETYVWYPEDWDEIERILA